ncbi:GNAT family N-acetyltransferase [Parasulfitobacter algicola]|uniref:GNAT family N-acetyltransferase n=1 Tax=Parasulfitobacter algicola TaxID=2614809 RepID=A0ABX2IK76_9RHOB|nr:GNAT family N-acetyltransferase [Sulfitobacter algicola]NSX53253.1 GNAT family N-acetyltransferase [Sulfitobacter algicola]
MIPVLRTKRLILRGAVMDDYPAVEAFFKSDRAIGTVGKSDNTADAFRRFATFVGHWHLMGFGWWMIEENNQPVGVCGIHHPPQKQHMELGWSLFEDAEGRGIAFEATTVALDYAKTFLTPSKLVSYIYDGNIRSERLAQKLGAVRDDQTAPHNDAVYAWVHPLGTKE